MKQLSKTHTDKFLDLTEGMSLTEALVWTSKTLPRYKFKLRTWINNEYKALEHFKELMDEMEVDRHRSGST
jgi:hypothetical protein